MNYDNTDCIDELFQDKDWLSPFKYNDIEYYGVKSRIEEVQKILPSGLSDEYQFTILCRSSDFMTQPANNEIITMNNTEFRILKKVTSPSMQAFRLHLGDKYG